MRVYLIIMIMLSMLELLIFAVNHYYSLPPYVFLGSIYLLIILLLAVSALISVSLARASGGEKRILFSTVAFLCGILTLSVFSVSHLVWMTMDYELKVEHLTYFLPACMLAEIPILGNFIWKILRETKYFNVKHVLPAIFAFPILASFFVYVVIGVEFKDLQTFSHLGTLIFDLLILLSLLILTSAYANTESAVYYQSFLLYFVSKYLSDISIMEFLKGSLSYEPPLGIFAFSNIALFTILYRFYSTEIRLLSYTEIDRERRRYAELYNQVNELQEILRLINRMLRHDILNKLQIISGYVETYRMTKKEELLDRILKAVDESFTYIDKLGELEKIVLTRRGGLKPVNLQKVAEGVAKSFNIEINIKGECVAMADEAIYSVIENLLSNAIKHGKTDKVDILLSEIEDECEIRIIDYGIGIPPEIREQIFNESFRYGEAGGTGLGLYIVKRLVDRYGGKIWVEDTKPHGATFVIRLKAARVKLDER